MVCILCISVSDEMLFIFDENGINLNISDIIRKHFWIKPNAEDNNAKAICCDCWKTVESFHKFYQTIEEAHAKFTTCLKLPIAEFYSEANHFESISDFFTPVVKIENSEDSKIELPENISIHSINAVAKVDESQRTSNSDSESEVPLVRLSNISKSKKEVKAEDNSNDSDSDNDDVSGQDNEDNEQDSNLVSSSDSDSEYNVPKKKAKVKKTGDPNGSSNKKRMPCKAFDNLIKRNMKPIVKLSTRLSTRKCTKSYVSSNYSFEQDSKDQHHDIENDVEGDSTNNSFKKEAKEKVSKAENGKLVKNNLPCKEFDNLIKKHIDLVCEICTKRQKNFFLLKDHFKNVHKTDGFVTCCNRQWNSRFSLVHHLILHQNPDLFKCNKCSRVLANKKSFNNHMRTHVIQQEPIKLQCEKCKKSFASTVKLRRHLKTHSADDTDQICDQCGKVYHTKQALKAHQRREHMGFVKERVQCPQCGVYLGDTATLKFHTKHLHPKVQVVNACSICGKVSATAYGLKRHMQYMHTMERIHKCSICEDKAFKTAQRLRVRM